MEAGGVTPGVVRRAWAQAVTPRVAIARTIPEGGHGLVAALTVANVLLGLLPVAFVVATSVVIGRVPRAVEAGLGSDAWHELVYAFLLAAASFVGVQVVTTVQGSLGELLKRRVDGRLRDRTMALTLSSTAVGPMEESSTLDALREATFSFESDWHTPGMACAGLLALMARYLRLIGFVVIVGMVFSWVAAVALLGATMTFRYGQRGGLRKFSQVWGRIVPLLRRGDYLRRVSLDGAAAKETKVFGLSGWLAGRYVDTVHELLADVWTERRRIYLWPYVWFTAIGLAIATVVLVWIARSAAAGEVTLTELALAMQASVAALLLGEHYPEADVSTQFGMRAVEGLRGVQAAMARVDVVSDGSVPQDELDRVIGAPRSSIGFERLTFAYPGGTRTVLDGLELELPAGICTAIVGVNGAGKTTLVKLLTRLYEPTAGAITVDGTPLTELDVRAWRRQVSVIFQDFLRYELSAADNIALGAAHAPRDPDAIRRAAEKAGALAAFEQLPVGLDTPLGRDYEGGVDLSGGQWQRLAIARSLYALEAGARVLVLDEPTSALDVRAEAAFFDSFVELTRGVTSLLISHRFSSVRRADRIVVIDRGRVGEQGTHDELMHANGTYAALFRLQAERFASGLDAEGEEFTPEEDDA